MRFRDPEKSGSGPGWESRSGWEWAVTANSGARRLVVAAGASGGEGPPGLELELEVVVAAAVAATSDASAWDSAGWNVSASFSRSCLVSGGDFRFALSTRCFSLTSGACRVLTSDMDRFRPSPSGSVLYPAHSSLFCLHVSQVGRSPEQAVLRLRQVKHAAPMRRLVEKR